VDGALRKPAAGNVLPHFCRLPGRTAIGGFVCSCSLGKSAKEKCNVESKSWRVGVGVRSRRECVCKRRRPNHRPIPALSYWRAWTRRQSLRCAARASRETGAGRGTAAVPPEWSARRLEHGHQRTQQLGSGNSSQVACWACLLRDSLVILVSNTNLYAPCMLVNPPSSEGSAGTGVVRGELR
jgi:hypothetical protein